MRLCVFVIALIALLTLARPVHGQNIPNSPVREKLLMDAGWRFALGHLYDTKKDFGHAEAYFSYLAKAGYADGPAAKDFDDRAWRVVDVPHDWCVELPFDRRGGFSHGYKAIGRNFPENSIGWYRRAFSISRSDLGRRISIAFDGVFRNAAVWVNGFYVGTEQSGYSGCSYDISDYLEYGGRNVVAVRVDASTEEGWFYEGAGIYRHVWLTKVSPLHVATDGVFVTTEIAGNGAVVRTRTTVKNDSRTSRRFTLQSMIVDSTGRTIASAFVNNLSLDVGEQQEYASSISIDHPALWSIENPSLYRLRTIVRAGETVVDSYETPFGIRSVRFDPDKGFFLNGKHVVLKGTNNHQDHAGIGVALPDAMQEFRIRQLKEMGDNAIRTSHNPPTPELLDACDRLGMLVMDENRLMGVNKEHLDRMEQWMKRDRNHPSVILWSLGNEEWIIEGNIKGARITTTMQDAARRIDSSRAFTVALSGGWDDGSGSVADVMGYNYIVQGDIDEHHKKFPWQAGVGTEESNTIGTRGIYRPDGVPGHMVARNRLPENVGTESGWQFYVARPFLSGLFYWTGFDYRGEMTPFDWPAVGTQFGVLDMCGFPKDIYFYLKSWWGNEPVLHLVPPSVDGNVVVYSNRGRVELLLDGKSLGEKEMPVNGHLEWKNVDRQGMLTARGYSKGEQLLESTLAPAGKAAIIQLIPDRTIIDADGEDVSVITVEVTDNHGVPVPYDSTTIGFSLEGTGRIIGVGNGDPASHEADRYVETVKSCPIEGLKELPVDGLENRPEVACGFPDSAWKPALQYARTGDWRVYADTLLVIRGAFTIPDLSDGMEVDLFSKSIVEHQSIYVNGHPVARGILRDAPDQSFRLPHQFLVCGKNDYAVVGQRFRKKTPWDEPNVSPGVVQTVVPAPQWKRKVFNGLAQVLVQSTSTAGQIVLHATANGLQDAETRIQTKAVLGRPRVPAE